VPDSARTQISSYEAHALTTLKNHGFRITMPRLLAIRALAATTVALDPYRLCDAIRDAGRRVDNVTGYRVLATLLECGLVYKVGMLDGKYWRRDNTYPSAVLAVDPSQGTVAFVAAFRNILDPLAEDLASEYGSVKYIQAEFVVGGSVGA
jgi:Fe2+ or Zn2+ uptake regulation protein